jgi:hypothetical protein
MCQSGSNWQFVGSWECGHAALAYLDGEQTAGRRRGSRELNGSLTERSREENDEDAKTAPR